MPNGRHLEYGLSDTRTLSDLRLLTVYPEFLSVCSCSLPSKVMYCGEKRGMGMSNPTSVREVFEGL